MRPAVLAQETEGEGFEPSVRLNDAQRFSRPPHSTTLPPLQVPAYPNERDRRGSRLLCWRHSLPATGRPARRRLVVDGVRQGTTHHPCSPRGGTRHSPR